MYSHPTYEDGSPMLLGDAVIVHCCAGCDNPKAKPATLVSMRIHPGEDVWMAVEGTGFASNEVIYDHPKGSASYIRSKVSGNLGWVHTIGGEPCDSEVVFADEDSGIAVCDKHERRVRKAQA